MAHSGLLFTMRIVAGVGCVFLMDEKEPLAAKPPHREKAIDRKVTTKAAILAGFPPLGLPSFQLFTAPERDAEILPSFLSRPAQR